MSEKPTITQEQAEARVDELIETMVADLSPKPKLSQFTDQKVVDRCLDPSDRGSTNRVIVTKRYWLRDIPKKEPNSAIANRIKTNMEKKGHQIDSATGLGTTEPNIHGRSRPDDFLMALESSADGSLSVVATSPCIWQGGTPGGEPTLD